jgi:dolichyl-phosphate-mannose-protein mannosyltransferase
VTQIHFKPKITKIDVITIVLLCLVFFSIAVTNLGLSQEPITTAQLTDEQSFYVDLGSAVSVKSVLILLKQGVMDVAVSAGSPASWQNDPVTSTWPYSNSPDFSLDDYYKWHEISIGQTTQYLKFNFRYYAVDIAEIVVVDENNQQVPIQSITNLAGDNPDLQNLIDEQGEVKYPLDYMSSTYFDEIYFVKTAEQYLHQQMPDNWVHPPLGKLIQAAGIAIFGFNPFGWRIMGVIFATLMIGLVYFLGKQMFGTWIGGFTAAFLLTFDFMHFTMGRLGVNDTYMVFFNVAAQLFLLIYLKNLFKDGWKTSVLPLGLAFLSFAFAFSTKWLVLYGFVSLLLILVVMRLNDVYKVKEVFSAKVSAFLKRPFTAFMLFILMAVGIYFVTYIPDMLAGRSPMNVINLQSAMYDFHAHLQATHPYSSPWYSWPLLFDPFNGNVHVPQRIQSTSLPNDTSSTIVAMGNPAVWWVGFAAIIAITILLLLNVFRKKIKVKENLPMPFLVVVFFFQWVPYFFISRIVFIYSFYVSVPILCLGSAFFISKYWSRKYMKVLAIAYFAAVGAMFVLFFPIISGSPASNSFIDSLKWFNSWVF